MRTLKTKATVSLLLGALTLSPSGFAEELLTGEIKDAGRFAIDAESRQKPEGGTISLGDHSWVISRVSVHGLIGASGATDKASNTLEHVVFSSSFSDMTATGTPWVAAKEVHGCDEAYNAFLAIYTVKADASGDAKYPFKALTDDVKNSQNSVVYCFYAGQPA